MMKKILLVLLTSRLLSADPVRIESGLVSGVDRQGVHAYLGIPYAAPPTADLRWRPPQRVKAWSGVLQADKFGPACTQPPSAGLEMSEDCLLMNVWTPVNRSSTPLPVMVWIHGGGFRAWNARTSGRGLVPQGVILVDIQYRLGVLGFFAHPALTKAQHDEPVANYGLMDQIAALQWVKRNIAAFGGDPERVTIFGESSGGNSVLFLMTSPEARGLFNRAICESSSGADPRTLETMEAEGAREAVELGAGEGAAAIATLRKMPAEGLLERINTNRTKRHDFSGSFPALDGRIVRGPSAVLFESGKQAPVPLIIGGNSHEGSQLDVGTRAMSDHRTPNPPADETVRKLYLDEARGDQHLAAAKLYGDGNILAPARLRARSMALVNQPVWVYFFSYVPEKIRGTVPGVAHGGELSFVFNFQSGSEADRRMAEQVSAFWVQFAKTGNPNPPGKTEWPSYTASSDQILELGEEIVVRTHFRKVQLDYAESAWRKGEFRDR